MSAEGLTKVQGFSCV